MGRPEEVAGIAITGKMMNIRRTIDSFMAVEV
jgi:hypothetical protein